MQIKKLLLLGLLIPSLAWGQVYHVPDTGSSGSVSSGNVVNEDCLANVAGLDLGLNDNCTSTGVTPNALFRCNANPCDSSDDLVEVGSSATPDFADVLANSVSGGVAVIDLGSNKLRVVAAGSTSALEICHDTTCTGPLQLYSTASNSPVIAGAGTGDLVLTPNDNSNVAIKDSTAATTWWSFAEADGLLTKGSGDAVIRMANNQDFIVEENAGTDVLDIDEATLNVTLGSTASATGFTTAVYQFRCNEDTGTNDDNVYLGIGGFVSACNSSDTTGTTARNYLKGTGTVTELTCNLSAVAASSNYDVTLRLDGTNQATCAVNLTTANTPVSDDCAIAYVEDDYLSLEVDENGTGGDSGFFLCWVKVRQTSIL